MGELTAHEKIAAADAVRDAANKFRSTLAVACAPSREISLALTNIEQAEMWAVRGIWKDRD